jgi:hypothetical protein
MSEVTIEVSKPIKAQTYFVGVNKTAVIIIDDFAIDTTELIGNACNHCNFTRQDNTYYPGIRARLPKDYVIDVLQSIYQHICVVYEIPVHLQLTPQEIYYSLITDAESKLSLNQCIPHFDTGRPYYFAILHYLNNSPHGNTGLFRHIPTGLERIDDENVENYLTATQNFMDKNGQPPQSYITSSTDHFELYHEIEYKPNRLVIYPGQLLHSTIVSVDKDIDPSPATGRLTANIFIEFK